MIDKLIDFFLSLFSSVFFCELEDNINQKKILFNLKSSNHASFFYIFNCVYTVKSCSKAKPITNNHSIIMGYFEDSEEDAPDPREQAFHEMLRENVIFLLILIILYGLSYLLISSFRKRREVI